MAKGGCGRLRVGCDLSGRGTTRVEDAQGPPTQSHISPSILVYEDKRIHAPSSPADESERDAAANSQRETMLVPANPSCTVKQQVNNPNNRDKGNGQHMSMCCGRYCIITMSVSISSLRFRHFSRPFGIGS